MNASQRPCAFMFITFIEARLANGAVTGVP